MFYNVKGEQIFLMQDHSPDNFNIYVAGKTLANPKWEALHLNNNDQPKYTFEYILKGKMAIETGSQKLIAQKGDFLYMNKNATHYSHTFPDEPVEKWFLVVNGTFIDEMVKLYGLNEKTVIAKLDVKENFNNIFSVIDNSEKQDIYDIVTSNLLSICQKFKRYRSQNLLEINCLESSVIYSISAYINENINENVTLNSLSELFHFTPNHIIRLFKSVYGITPKQYVLETKMDAAKQMLSYTKISIDDISRRLNFATPNHFSRAFKSAVGITPRDYRKQYLLIVRAHQNQL